MTKFTSIISALLLSLIIFVGHLMADNRICFRKFEYVSDLDYFFMGYKSVVDTTYRSFATATPGLAIYPARETIEEQLDSMVFDIKDGKQVQVLIVNNKWGWGFKGKQINVIKDDSVIFLEYSPCGERRNAMN